MHIHGHLCGLSFELPLMETRLETHDETAKPANAVDAIERPNAAWYLDGRDGAAANLWQVPTGRIEGTLQDSSGAVILVAQLSLVNERTQTRLFAESGSEGFSSLGIPCGSLRNGIG